MNRAIEANVTDAPAKVALKSDVVRSNVTRESSCEFQAPRSPVCPVCGDSLMEIRAKLQCVQCHTICETCCEGGRG